MYIKQTQWPIKGANTATKTGIAGKNHLIAHIFVTCTTTGTVQVKSGTTVLWEFDMTSNTNQDIMLDGSPIPCDTGADATVAFSSGTGKVNFLGITV